MPDECVNPVWPCAMTGAAACLSGFEDLGVIVHGSSGCYYYTEAALPGAVHCTFLLEEEIIFGGADRLREIATEIAALYPTLAVVLTCVPSIAGEDVRQALEGYRAIVVDTPGFTGNVEAGYRIALKSLHPLVDPETKGVNIDGLCSFDQFYAGNRREAVRMLNEAGIASATCFSAGRLESLAHAAPVTVAANPDFMGGPGRYAGSLTGIDELKRTFTNLGDIFPDADVGIVLEEIELTEERIIHAGDRFLRRFDPPATAIFSTSGYALSSANLLKRYIDADIVVIGTRGPAAPSIFRTEETIDLEHIGDLIGDGNPDLILGSSYERSIAPETAFVGITPPLRGMVTLRNTPLTGTEGLLFLAEASLNACIEGQKREMSSGIHSNS